uniref:UBC core domain-containing protein n=1 Tax=Ostreococcus mediterraneus TaxID=1486918 RepID=A0A7S0KMH6_9CHLO|mmetsp:Transcript_7272/g.26560  ORF Transcript_7272/g.26560 Transcript_7272/m.26560 type:complete len:154 (+) Transcript_7272:342-803(+)
MKKTSPTSSPSWTDRRIRRLKVGCLKCGYRFRRITQIIPRKAFFVTKIFHPNIRQPSGEICVNTLKRDWQPTHGLRHILMVIRCLLIEPFPESALNEEAGKLLLEDYDEYFRRAKMYTSIHAKPEADKATETSEDAPASKAKKVDKKKSLRRL